MQAQNKPSWIALSTSLGFMFKSKRVFIWSLILIVITIGATWGAFSLGTHYLDMLYLEMFTDQPVPVGWWAIIKSKLWAIISWFYIIGTRIVCFYLSFLLAYCITCPGYFFLSHAAEKIYAGKYFDPDAAFTLKGVLIDLLEGIKIAMLGVVVTFFAFWLNFIPVIGQGTLLLIYTFYSTLIFIDYPASRRRWTLGRKMSWIRENNMIALRIGLAPAVVSLIPFVNIFGMALIFPVMTVHATLNFAAIEIFNKQHVPQTTKE